MTILNGWKEIANYLGRGVRTVQRWEHLGLPVHRPRGASRSAVTALADEMNAWVAACPSSPDDLLDLQEDNKMLRTENEKLREQCSSLRRQLEENKLVTRLVVPNANQAGARPREANALQQGKAI